MLLCMGGEQMKEFLLLLVAAVSGGLCFGRSAEFELRKLGDGIMSIPVSVPAGLYNVFDFSKDSRYIWTSETNCYDLAGHQAETGKLDAASYQLPRMKWKQKFVGTDELSVWYPFDAIEERLKSDAKAWFQSESGGRGQNLSSYVRLTFPSYSDPFVAVVFMPFDVPHDLVSVARFTEDDEIVFGPVKKIRCHDFIDSLDLSPDIRHFVMMMSKHDGIHAIKIMRTDIGSDAIEYTDNSIVDVVSKAELEQLFGEKRLWIYERGHGFANENYYVFSCNRGGRFSFTARDYFVVYGIREKRIVKVFKSRLRWFDEGCEIRDIDYALSADEKYVAIRYDDEITVYKFSVGSPADIER